MRTEPTLLIGLLFVAAAAAGWAVARYTAKSSRPSTDSLREDYFQGLRLLLNQQTDQALKVFTRLAEEDRNTFEAHLLVGGLFRRRGEVDRAIRIHESLLARENLTTARRAEALHSLAQDFEKAGLFDRAEELYNSLAESTSHRAEALRGLVSLYEQERDWDKAIGARSRLESVDKQHQRDVIPHYYCELAQTALANGDTDSARAHLRTARKGRHKSGRAALMRGEIALSMGETDLAFRLFDRALERQPALFYEILAQMARVSKSNAMPAQRFDDHLETLIRRQSGLRERLEIASLIEPDLPEESNVILRSAGRCLSAEGQLAHWLPVIGEADSGQRLDVEGLKRLRATIIGALAESPRYRCVECGYDSRQFNWQCPSCKRWDTAAPLDRVVLGLGN
ncbi:MAG: tetratricopeptide repeat protein [Chromatiales bacterium]|nr:tetratricopeptide repeat protein [Chromatiales bacterium]